MSDILIRKEAKPRSSSHAQLFIIVHPSNTWSFATINHANGLWLTTQVRQTNVSKIHTGFSPPGDDVKYFEITSMPNSWLRDVQVRVDLVAAIGIKGDLECNHQYVRDILESLVVGGILGKTQSFKDLSLLPDSFGFEARNLWSILKQGPYHWNLYQGLLIYGDTCIKMTQVVPVERPEGQLLYFELASFESDRQEYVDRVVFSTDPKDADDRWECNRNQEKADDLLSELETASKEIELH
ncbi:hypothetical protein FPCIR_4747 [Fusarium pseudocircinatum]|uniref:Uncharacterized protein n=1 Tax=Fusarium pseudocircinatum TaxID=56676 RepID=A0A8H5PDT2_9HYPO|nr:hypothetical protein FPCIR_4747 [Fusarium pseudocircinatum]